MSSVDKPFSPVYTMSHLFMKKWLTPTTITVILSLLYVLTVLWQHNGDPMAFVLTGTRFTTGDPQGTEGYDGQFAYQIARAPLEATPYIDVPAYRYQRILYPLLARLFALGQPSLIPWSLILVNLLAIALGTWATEQLLRELRVNRWHAVTYGLYGGQLLALRTDLNEPLAQALVQCAMLAWAKDRQGLTILAFSLAALSKETSLIFLVAYIIYCAGQRNWGAAFNLSLAGLPFGLYQLMLWGWLGEPGVGSGGAGATPFSPIPLGGWLAIIQVSLPAFLLISLVVGPMSVLPGIAGTVMSIQSLRRGLWHPFVVSLFLNSVILLCLPMSTFREPAAMARLTQGLVAALLLYAGLTKSHRTLRYCSLWLFTGVLLINGVAT